MAHLPSRFFVFGRVELDVHIGVPGAGGVRVISGKKNAPDHDMAAGMVMACFRMRRIPP
jgi:hypothetical protein